MAKSRFRVPHTLVLLFGMVLLAQLLTYLLPAGSYDYVDVDASHRKVIADSYHRVEGLEPLPVWTPSIFSFPREWAV